MKKRISILLILLIMLMSIPFTYGDTIHDAEVLQDLKLLKGDGKGFNLGGQLKRSEAATFIVKFLGKEVDVLNNVSSYNKTMFEDVESDMWYAPFIGYCHANGIVSGFEDGTFRPDSFVSEKAFLSMLLQAMEYKADVDFDWDSVLSFAYSKGLVENIEYAVRTEDNNQYVRGDVVRAMYNALTQPLKNSKRTVVERLIDEKVTNMVVAKRHDLIKEDELITKIETAVTASKTEVEVVFNEAIQAPSKADIRLTNGEKTIDIIGLAHDGEKVIIESKDAFYEPASFKVEFNQIVDEDNNITEDLEADFEGYEKEKIESDHFRISFIEPITSELIKVTFTQPVDERALMPLMYRFGAEGQALVDGNFKNLEILSQNDSKTVLIKFKSLSMIEDESYALQVRGDLLSTYEQRMNQGEGDTLIYEANISALNSFEVDDYEVVDKNHIELEFSRPVGEKTALDEDNYRLFNLDRGSSQNPMKVYWYQDEDGISENKVVLKFGSILERTDYRIEVDDVFDIYSGTRVEHYEDSFSEKDIDKVIPEIDDVRAVDRSTVEVMFTQPLTDDVMRASFRIDGERDDPDVDDVYWNENQPTRVLLYLRKSDYLDEDEDYTLRHNGSIEDYLGRDADKSDSDDFDGNDHVRDQIDISSAKYISDDTIRVTLTDIGREIDLEDTDNYLFEYRNSNSTKKFYPTDVEFISHTEVLLKTDFGIGDGSVRLYMYDIYDYSGQFKVDEISSGVDLKE